MTAPITPWAVTRAIAIHTTGPGELSKIELEGRA